MRERDQKEFSFEKDSYKEIILEQSENNCIICDPLIHMNGYFKYQTFAGNTENNMCRKKNSII